MRTPLSVVIGAGGTGGHIYPGLALAEALRRAEPDAVISFIGTERGLETTLIPAAGYRLHTVDMIPFDPALGAKRFLLPAALLRSGAQARSVLRRQQAQVVVGMGGYPSAPAIVGARMAGLPSVIHESNAVPGRANQFAARLTEHLTVAFDRSRAHLSGGERALTVGMPIAASLAALDRPALRAQARRAFGIPEGARVVLFNGGSLGAARLTAAAVGLAARWRDRSDVHLLIKTGPAALAETRWKLADAGAGAVAPGRPVSSRPTPLPAPSRRRCPTSTGWTSPTRWPTWWSAGRARPRSRSWRRPGCPPSSCRTRTPPATTRPTTPGSSPRPVPPISSPTPRPPPTGSPN